jgi:hypothetical protein
MTELGLRPRSSTELVDAAFQVFRRDPVPFMLAAAVFYVPWLLIRLALDAPLAAGELDWSRALISALISVFVYATASAAVTLLARDVYLNRPSDLAGVLRAVVPRIPTLVATSAIVFVCLAIGATFFLLPALYPLARFFATRQAIVIEGTGVGASLARSSTLSIGVKRHVLSTLILAGLIVFAISIGSVLMTNLIPSRVLVFAVATGISVIVYPFLAIVQTLLYYDVRIRKEGFDIEYLAGESFDAVAGTRD